MDEVNRIEKENLAKKELDSDVIDERWERRNKMPSQSIILPTPRGYFVLAKVGPVVRPFDGADFSASFVNGIHLIEYVSIGVGVDLTNVTYDDENISTITVMPVYLDTRFYIPRKRVNPMFHFQFGYGTVVDRNGGDQFPNGSLNIIPIKGKGGFFMALGAGMRILIS